MDDVRRCFFNLENDPTSFIIADVLAISFKQELTNRDDVSLNIGLFDFLGTFDKVARAQLEIIKPYTGRGKSNINLPREFFIKNVLSTFYLEDTRVSDISPESSKIEFISDVIRFVESKGEDFELPNSAYSSYIKELRLKGSINGFKPRYASLTDPV